MTANQENSDLPAPIKRTIGKGNNNNPPIEVLGLFAKYWEPGKVKTRLANCLGTNGAQRSAKIYTSFLSHLVTKFSVAAMERYIVFSPRDRESDFREFCSSLLSVDTWQRTPQIEADLGSRMRTFFEQQFAQDPNKKVIVIGSDSPQLSTAMLKQAYSQLDEHDVVLGPSTDGGYYLVGMKRRVQEIFAGITWSQNTVLAETETKLKNAGTKYCLLEPLTDVDELDDLVALSEFLKQERENNHNQEPTVVTEKDEGELEASLLKFIESVLQKVDQ